MRYDFYFDEDEYEELELHQNSLETCECCEGKPAQPNNQICNDCADSLYNDNELYSFE